VLGTLTLPGSEPFVALARTFVRGLLPEGHPAAEDVVTVAGELVSNAVLHSDSGKQGGLVTLTLEERCEVFLLEVTDDGAGGASPGLRDEGGRGLRTVDLLALRWGFLQDAGHTIVWAEFAR
jgi:anti-sigma regulatory factor (Ser/Thr protein kinase)